MIDDDEIREIKAGLEMFGRAEKWELASKMVELDDELLEKAVKILKLPPPGQKTGSDFKTIPIQEKLNLNFLTDVTRDIITSAISYSPIVKKFVTVRCRTESLSAEALKAYFFNLYQNMRRVGFLGDDLFDSMIVHIGHITKDIQLQSAAIAILVYLFLMCDVFEKTEKEKSGVKLI